MRAMYAGLAMIVLAACSGGGETRGPDALDLAVTAPASDTRLVAVLSYADWCGSCRTLDPKIENALESGAIEGVHFVVLDYTARDQDAYFAAADTARIGGPVRAHFADGVSTGMLLLIDLDDGEIIGDLRKHLSAEEIRAALERAAEAS